MRDPLLNVLLVTLLLVCTPIAWAKCPSVNISPCSCSDTDGLLVYCPGSLLPELIQKKLVAFNGLRIDSLTIQDITGSFYLPSDFLSGNVIVSVDFECDHGSSITNGPLTVSSNAFVDATSGECTVGNALTFKGCNMREFNAQSLTKCDQQLAQLRFTQSYVESILNFPQLDQLEILFVTGNKLSLKPGLSKFQPDPKLLPKLSNLDLSFNSLVDDDISLISNMTNLSEITLRGNHFSLVPDLTKLRKLGRIEMDIDGNMVDNFGLKLPKNRKTHFDILLYDSATYNKHPVKLTSIEGDVKNSDIQVFLNLTEVLDESVFYEPLKAGGDSFNIFLDPDSRFDCNRCEMAWLFRDNQDLVPRLKNGVCDDGRPFENIETEELLCCPNSSLLQRIQRLEMELRKQQKLTEEL